MKTKHLFLSALTCLTFAACSNDDDAVQNPQGEVVDKQYLAVQFTIPGLAETRADVFETANETELAVSDVAFFFFNDNGNTAANPCYVTIADAKNFWKNSISHTHPENSDEAESSLVLLVEKAQPNLSQVVAVLNPTSEIRNLVGGNAKTPTDDEVDIDGSATITSTLTLENLRKEVLSVETDGSKTYYSVPSLTAVDTYADNSKCLMSNSAYYSDGGAPVYATQVGNALSESREEALSTPLTIHVERVEARVSVTPPALGGETAYELRTKAGGDEINAENGGTDIKLYFELTGWWLNNTSKDAYLIKQLATTYAAGWNNSAHFRSYWGVSWAEGTAADGLNKGQKYGSANLFDKYCLENTTATSYTYADKSKDNNTGVDVTTATQLVAEGQIVDSEGNGVSVVSFNNTFYTVDEFLKVVAATLNSNGYLNGVNQVTYTDLKMSIAAADDNNLRDYEAKVMVADEVTLTKDDIDANEEVNTMLSTVYGNVKYWNEGKTYYYTRIKHDYAADGTYSLTPATDAIIRNHWYKISITGFYGLGTPVSNPDIPIIPVTPPTDKISYLACNIAVLKYRVVSQDVSLGGDNSQQ